MSPALRRAVFLDRDGVINRAIIRDGMPASPRSISELEVLPGVAEALDEFRAAGFVQIVVTNQPDVARGWMARETLDAIHRVLLAQLPIEEIVVCIHDDADHCPCRKPRPGMLCEAAGRWGIDLSRSIMVGDRWRDISAGRAAGCRTFLIGDGYGEIFPHPPDAVASSLPEVREIVIETRARSGTVRPKRRDAWAGSRT
jgi:D-glycero-D-manno-heptose 1,7-bisphosphate phosphatase